MQAGRDIIIRDNIIIQMAGPAEPDDRTELLILWNNVRRQWIEEAPESSAGQLDLSMEARPDAIPRTRAAELEALHPARRSIVAGRTLLSLFDQATGALLLLGLAGSGKTTCLLQLACDLGDRATANVRSPIPVVLNLSTWTGEAPLFAWLVEELARYRVPRWQATAWLKDRRLILLLDGLDEVRPEARAACVHAINGYGEEVGIGGLVVCSRLDEYLALGVQLKVGDAFCLQPLTHQQVEGYLAAEGPPLAALRAAWQSDDQLRALAETPLMLSVMSLVYRDRPVEAISGPEGDVGQRREHLFTAYVQEVFARRAGRLWPYPQECIRFWLIWLARQMQQRTQTVFLIEGLQPDWLTTRAERYVYTVASRLLGGAALGLVLGAILDLAMGQIAGDPINLVPQVEDLLHRVTVGLALGLVSGLVAGVTDAWRFERSRRRGELRSSRTARQVVLDVTGYALAMGFVGWLVVARIGRWDDPENALLSGLLVGLLFGLFFGLHDSRRGTSEDIRTVEALRWSWAGARRSCVQGGLGGLAVGLVVGLVVSIGGEQVVAGKPVDGITRAIGVVLVGGIGSVVGALVGLAFGALRSSTVPTKARPNEGIALSFRNAVRGGVVTGGLVGVLLGAASALFLRGAGGMNAGLVGGLFFGLLAALRDGGLDVIQHYTLRLTLALRGYTPLDCARFLDHAVTLALLRRPGGGYLFQHRLLLEHFANLTPATSGPSACVRAGLVAADGQVAKAWRKVSQPAAASRAGQP